jgi:hypothetical protein
MIPGSSLGCGHWNVRQIWIGKKEQKREDQLITLTSKNAGRGEGRWS